jgi:4-carboxymuconolactone decarboxylase
MFAAPEASGAGGVEDRDARVAARQAAILGRPPRIGPLPQDAFPPEAAVLNAQIDVAAGLPPEEGRVSEWMATVIRHPALFTAHTGLALVLMAGGTLPARDRELAVLRTGWLAQAPFEWSGHVELAKRLAGISSEEIERVTVGSAAPGWSAHDAAVLRAVEEMVGNAMISDATWAVLAASYDECQLMELPVLVGQYLGVAFLQNSLRTPLSEGYGGLGDR